MELTQEKIDKLIKRRDSLLTRRDGLYDHAVVDRIDAQLAQVPPGVNNDVDLLLGRRTALLEIDAIHDPDSPRERLARQQRASMDDESILKNYPFSAAACQIRRERTQAASSTRWSTDAERAAWQAHGAEETALAAQAKQDEFLMYIADQTEDYLDFNQIRGDLAL